MKAVLDRARGFVYRNARPVDLARWRFHFENGGREAVLEALSLYQNTDGGFGWALEPDSWNPASTPMQTWAATEIIKEIGMEDGRHPLIQGALRYLSSGDAFDGRLWRGLNAVETNDDHPHAPWWAFCAQPETSYNPTAALAGFMLKYAEGDDALQRLGRRLAEQAYQYFTQSFPLDSMYESACFVELYEYLKAAGMPDAVPMREFRTLLQRQIRELIRCDAALWDTEYVCKPSLLIHGRSSDFYADNRDMCRFEASFIRERQNFDGTWNLTWDWGVYPQQWAVSRNWWQSDIIIKNLLTLKEFGGEAI